MNSFEQISRTSKLTFSRVERVSDQRHIEIIHISK